MVLVMMAHSTILQYYSTQYDTGSDLDCTCPDSHLLAPGVKFLSLLPPLNALKHVHHENAFVLTGSVSHVC